MPVVKKGKSGKVCLHRHIFIFLSFGHAPFLPLFFFRGISLRAVAYPPSAPLHPPPRLSFSSKHCAPGVSNIVNSFFCSYTCMSSQCLEGKEEYEGCLWFRKERRKIKDPASAIFPSLCPFFSPRRATFPLWTIFSTALLLSLLSFVYRHGIYANLWVFTSVSLLS